MLSRTKTFVAVWLNFTWRNVRSRDLNKTHLQVKFLREDLAAAKTKMLFGNEAGIGGGTIGIQFHRQLLI